MNLSCKLDNYFIPKDGHLEFVVESLPRDLQKAMDRIHQAAQESFVGSPTTLLQPTRNKLRQSVEHLQVAGAPFFETTGQCMGASEWFAALFLNFRKEHPEIPVQQALTLISKEFVKGVGIQAAYIQKNYRDVDIHKKIKDLLHIELVQEVEWKPGDKNICLELINKVSELKDGVYCLGFSGVAKTSLEDEIPGHATVVVVDQKNYYFFDINNGLVTAGKDVGTAKKENDVIIILAICNGYSASQRAESKRKSELEKIAHLFSANDISIIKKVVSEHLTDHKRVFLTAHEVYGIFHGFEAKGKDRGFTSEQQDALMMALCIRPGQMKLLIELYATISLEKIEAR